MDVRGCFKSYVILVIIITNIFCVYGKNINELSCHSNTIKKVLDFIIIDRYSKIEDNSDILKVISESALTSPENSTIKYTFNSTIKNNVLKLNSGHMENGEFINKYQYSGSYRNISVLAKSDINFTSDYMRNGNYSQHWNEDFGAFNFYNDTGTPEFSQGWENEFYFVKVLPSFDPRISKKISDSCRIEFDAYLHNLNAMKLWALKMYDASGKVPAGLMSGNVNQYGDFDQCLQVDSSVAGNQLTRIRGKYCLASFQVTLQDEASPREREIYDMIHSHHAFRSQLRDPGHRVPRFSSITWGLCIPQGCSSEDVQLGLEAALLLHLNKSLLGVEVLVEPQMCQVEASDGLSKGTIIVGCLFTAVILLALCATKFEDSNNLIASFSLRKNFKTLFSLERVSDDIEAVHGIRCLNALMLLVSHKSMAIFFLPYMNRTEMAESLGRPWSVIGRAASLYTDPFIMFSGLLTCYSFIGRYNKKRSVSIIEEYIGRLFRLLPTLGALILFCTWILPEIGSGPQWPLVISHHADICKQHWWRNLLFVHNYFGFQNMCLTHTHHIGIDTQLFCVGVPLVLWFASKKERTKKAVIILSTLAAISTIARFYVTYTMELANYVYFGTSVEQLFRTADYMYILPAHRFTVYAMGLCLGLMLRYIPKRQLTKTELIIGWTVSMTLLCGAFLGPAGMGRVHYKYSAWSAACYAAFAPIAWCNSFAWIVYTTHHGYNSFLGDIFSWRGFVVWTRLSYAVYLTQFPVFFYNVGETRTPQHYSFLGAMIDLNEIFLILISSIVLTVLFDLPFQNIKKILFGQKRNLESVAKTD